MKLLYNTAICIFSVLARLLAPFNTKAGLWVRGMKEWEKKVTDNINPGERNVWIHCASLGEFEQGRTMIEAIKNASPDIKILLTFFSPSGYEIRKNYPLADCIIYLPPDTPANAARLTELVNPEYVIFVKYEFWHNYISALHNKGIRLYLISGIFRPGQHFFRWYGAFFRQMLGKFERIFVQDQRSADLLAGIGFHNVSVTGDTRFDRVIQITATAREIEKLDQFRGGEKLFLAGSSWDKDEAIITRYINKYPERMKWVFAPHEIHESNIERLEKLLKVKHVRFSEFNETTSGARVLIIDNIGMLSSAYKYAGIAAIGGGFGKGIHNILEPACWGIPVLFGPRHKNFREAVELINEKGAFSFDSFDNFSKALDKLLTDEPFCLKSGKTTLQYITKNTGATGKILAEISRKDINSKC
jgi:3-deoxy-D-manno-octulosonic-acid transferase